MRVISVWKSFCFNLVCFVLVTLWTVEHGTDNCPSSIGEIKRESLLNVNRLRESVWPNNFVSYPYFFFPPDTTRYKWRPNILSLALDLKRGFTRMLRRFVKDDAEIF